VWGPGPQNHPFNPWGARTLEWQAREPGENGGLGGLASINPSTVRPDTGISSSALGMWLFLASTTMLFGSLFSAYAMLRAGSTTWPGPFSPFPWLETALLIGASAAFGHTRIRLISAHALGFAFVAVRLLKDAVMIRKGLVPSASLQLACWFAIGGLHTSLVVGGAAFSGWLAGPAFRTQTENRERWTARLQATGRYGLFLGLVWLALVGAFYL